MAGDLGTGHPSVSHQTINNRSIGLVEFRHRSLDFCLILTGIMPQMSEKVKLRPIALRLSRQVKHAPVSRRIAALSAAMAFAFLVLFCYDGSEGEGEEGRMAI
jgi:hypothetical protein